ncbi:hypothetical protein IJE86_08485, partial [bacterium]|nr:hypothetical protein [bacterium]
MGSAVPGANTMFTQKAWNQAQFKVQQICGDIQVLTNLKTQLIAMYCDKKQAIMNKYSTMMKGSNTGGV